MPQEQTAALLSPRQRRTYEALLNTAAAMLDEGLTPTLTEVADRAEVGRATAYRHFASSERLLAEAALDRIARQMVALRLPTDAATPEAAVEALVAQVLGFVIANRETFRLMLRLSLEPGAGPRGARRLGWARAVLAPHAGALRPGAVEALAPALAVWLGPETLVALQDVAGLDDVAALGVAQEGARALVAAWRA